MSVWHMTRYDSYWEQEMQWVIVLPDDSPDENKPFDTCVMLPDRAREADWFLRSRALEDQFCRGRGIAVLCLPGRLAESPRIVPYLNGVLPQIAANIFPLKLTSIYLEGSSTWLMDAGLVLQPDNR